MPWTDYFWARPPSSAQPPPSEPPPAPPSTPPTKGELSITSTLGSYTTALPPWVGIALPTALLTSTALISVHLYRTRLRPLPTAAHIPPSYFRQRTLYGYVLSVGDGDNFRLLHTPGGRAAGWGVLPWRSKHLAPTHGKMPTVHVRIAGVDAPELAHFGRPAQPYGQEALEFLREEILRRNVRVKLYRRDQYERVVGTAWVRAGDGRVLAALGRIKGWPRAVVFPDEVVVRLVVWIARAVSGRRWRDVGLEMIRGGWATVYEAKFGSEFGGEKTEGLYRSAEAEAKRKGVGMWSGGKSVLEKEEASGWLDWFKGGSKTKSKVESPREYKNRMKELEEGKK